MSAIKAFGCSARPTLSGKSTGDCSSTLRTPAKQASVLSRSAFRRTVNRRSACTRIVCQIGDNHFPHFPMPSVPLDQPGLDGLYGLSTKQMKVMGLTGADDGYDVQNEVTSEMITAKNNYRLEIPSMSAMETTMRGGGGGGSQVPGQAPPDLPSLLLNSRIVYLGMPLVPAVTELLVAELLFLSYDNAQKPIYLYINSTGSQTQEGQSLAFETEAYAIMDTMQYVKPPIHTVCVGKAWGNAAMLLASGEKGQRHSLPNASIMTCPPRMNRTQDCATNLMIKSNELKANTETYVDFLTQASGRTREQIYKDVERTRWFTPETAIEYGLIDKVIQKGEDVSMDKQDYEAMLKMAQAQQQGGRYQPSAAGGAGMGGM